MDGRYSTIQGRSSLAQRRKTHKIYFYYVSSDDRKERPEFSSKAEFWQNIWDGPERSNQIIKRLNGSKKGNGPPRKKQGVTVSPQPNKAAVSSSQTFNIALSMLLSASWKTTYGATIKFPTKLNQVLSGEHSTIGFWNEYYF